MTRSKTMKLMKLDKLYLEYNKREFVSPDPLELLYDYPNVRDREIVALIASSLAYGRVAQILKSVNSVLEKMKPSPRKFLDEATPASLKKTFKGFKHRFTTDKELVGLMLGVKQMNDKHSSLYNAFFCGMSRSDTTVLPALHRFVSQFNEDGQRLLPSPEKGSACKRLNLYMRWMVRKDAVDPGGWQGIPRGRLIIPLDTHMETIGKALGLTQRKSADLKMAQEITLAFKKIAPRDPTKYDFALTRFGIRSELKLDDLIKRLT
jgi:uncharacterized protein (TIGR02757 family)